MNTKICIFRNRPVYSVMGPYYSCMKKVFALVLLLAGCTTTPRSPETKDFPTLYVTDDAWATYESRWVVRFELSLKAGAFGYDSYYRLIEHYEKKNSASSVVTSGTYTTHYNWKDNLHAITLHDLNTTLEGGYLRYKQFGKSYEEMYFLSRGNQELIPCDDNFNALTEDPRYTLHKRSRLFTVEGYITFENDSATFFERNTHEHWKVANLGEIQELKKWYRKLARRKYEGVYMRALAYSIQQDITRDSLDYLVVKKAFSIGQDPEVK